MLPRLPMLPRLRSRSRLLSRSRLSLSRRECHYGMPGLRTADDVSRLARAAAVRCRQLADLVASSGGGSGSGGGGSGSGSGSGGGSSGVGEARRSGVGGGSAVCDVDGSSGARVLRPLDKLSASMCQLLDTFELARNTHPDAAFASAADEVTPL